MKSEIQILRFYLVGQNYRAEKKIMKKYYTYFCLLAYVFVYSCGGV